MVAVLTRAACRARGGAPGLDFGLASVGARDAAPDAIRRLVPGDLAVDACGGAFRAVLARNAVRAGRRRNGRDLPRDAGLADIPARVAIRGRFRVGAGGVAPGVRVDARSLTVRLGCP